MKSLLAALGLSFLLFPSAHAVKVDGPNEAEQAATQIVTGTVLTIYGKTAREGEYEVRHCLAEVRVESVEKGEGLKAGQVIYVRYIGLFKRTGDGTPTPGPGPHENIPSEGERRRICLVQQKDGALDVYYVSGFRSAGLRSFVSPGAS